MKKKNISSTMRQIYGTGNFNPRRFDRRPKKSAKRLYMWGIGLFLLAVASVIFGGMYLFTSTTNSFTGEKIEVEFIGSVNPQIAQDEEYSLEITNNEDVALASVQLFINWPSSFEVLSDNASVSFVSSSIESNSEDNNTWDLGEIGARQTKEFNFTVRFSGEEGDIIELPYSLTLQPKGFSSDFVINESKDFSLGDPTIDLEISGPDSAPEESEISFEIEIGGIEKSAAENMFLHFEYPESFSVSELIPELEEDQELEIWKLSDLESNGKYSIKAKGDLEGKIGDKKRFIAFIKREGESGALIATEKTVEIQSADIGVSIIAKPAQGKKLQWGEQVNFTVNIENKGSYVARDIVVSVDISPEELWSDSSMSISNEGFFESGKIIWDSSASSKLDTIRPEGDVDLSFGFKTLSSPPNRFTGKPSIVAKASVQSKFGEQDISVESSDYSINVLAEVDFDVSGWYKSPEGIKWGEGPNPPLSGQETTYAIIWVLGPTSSALKDIEYRAKLPSNVVYKRDTNYSVGEITYDVEEREVVWRASRIPKLELPVEVRFMLGITPVSQATNSTKLLEQTDISIVDAAANEKLEFFGNAVTIGSTQ
jgi:hypothetical protein